MTDRDVRRNPTLALPRIGSPAGATPDETRRVTVASPGERRVAIVAVQTTKTHLAILHRLDHVRA